MREGQSLGSIDEDDLHPLQVEALRRMTPAKRLRIGLQMREMAWGLKTAGVRMQHRDWPDSRIEEEVRRIFLDVRT